ncbi:MAG: 4Fe-4S binding protein [Armatimonadota bacterium]
MAESPEKITRRQLLAGSLRTLGVFALGGSLGWLTTRAAHGNTVWQLDPNKCIQCGNCATACVLDVSAVKCVHGYAICGYCELCTGFFEPKPNSLNTGAENQLCPVDAIKRTFVEDPYYQYTIDEKLCIGCAKCVKGCNAFGNSSLFLQVRHDRCVNCNDCAIARSCPAQAFTRVPADHPYLLKSGEEERG